MFTSYDLSRALCANLGGEISTDREYEMTLGNPQTCQENKNKFWTAIKLKNYLPEKDYTWVIDQNGSKASDITDLVAGKWKQGQPNGEGAQMCVYRTKDNFLVDTECDRELCFICNVPVAQKYYLRGHNDVLAGRIDNKYFLILEKDWNELKITFKGEESGKITWYPVEKKTDLISNPTDANQTITYNQNPFGLLRNLHTRWIFTNVSATFYQSF